MTDRNHRTGESVRPLSTYDTREWETLADEPWAGSVMRRGDEHALEVQVESGFAFRRALYPLSGHCGSFLAENVVARRILLATLLGAVQNDRAPDVADFTKMLWLVRDGPADELARRLEDLDGPRGEVRYWLAMLYRTDPAAPDLAAGSWHEILERLGF